MSTQDDTKIAPWTRLRVEREGAIATVTLDRPEVLHALDAVMFDELERAFARARGRCECARDSAHGIRRARIRRGSRHPSAG